MQREYGAMEALTWASWLFRRSLTSTLDRMEARSEKFGRHVFEIGMLRPRFLSYSHYECKAAVVRIVADNWPET
jgi:hypothetical protein